ncbi:complex I NDUFA9 subunit family protein [Desulfuromonas acetoxidans]|uniref:NAD-dependent epimerase/dehydratase n=1 Tax=Desulfuromonas acetoxidans (strain DSM 684 / 11070) TaxID=281689 RepID=Q1K3T7_DESA6|nr:complex I NDUFA9 subunit family protein [Desulfuromonas acetoxidans]EAT17366.1 NAD-dependent epimerase/dehydratase [Desulfuromonas acetoxidans DSM 684]MBF0644251.1 complex I NDUFA9 subunit family protein [Desulfuromonas acetoxidans]NVD24879.1 complex I NDUFA9 subunit family protein [Desulfuromonas acetoxidans]NVE15180.1 complex I NDUFA9 subunit family protein [Desulfuromonas acetoxidans]
MRIFLTGATGFVGHHVIQALLLNGHTVRCLVRKPTPSLTSLVQVETVQGDITNPAELKQAMSDCDAIIHLVGIIRAFPQRGITFEKLHVEATRNIITAAAEAGIDRYLHMSANGASPDCPEAYGATKWRAEELVRQSRLTWTIFRPSLIFGPDGEFTRMLIQQLRFLPMIPIIGDGHYQLSPVNVDDVALGFANALSSPQAIGKIYHCCGPDTCSYNDLIDLIGHALGRKRVFKLHHPLILMQPITRFMERFAFFPVTSDQISMLIRGNVCNLEPWASELNLTPTPLADIIKKALAG